MILSGFPDSLRNLFDHLRSWRIFRIGRNLEFLHDQVLHDCLMVSTIPRDPWRILSGIFLQRIPAEILQDLATAPACMRCVRRRSIYEWRHVVDILDMYKSPHRSSPIADPDPLNSSRSFQSIQSTANPLYWAFSSLTSSTPTGPPTPQSNNSVRLISINK